MNKLVVITICFFITSCSIVTVEHHEGRLPKIKIKSGIKGCKIRPEIDFGDYEVYFKCKWKVSI